ncbi:high-affinity nickel-transport family protein [Mixta calida]
MWDRIAILNEHMGVVGYASVAMFVAIWGLSVLNYRYRRYDRLTA